MKNTLFESILKENSLVDRMIKDFDDVEVGDIGEDYNGTQLRIIKKGTIGSLLELDSTGAAHDYIEFEPEAADYEAVAVEDLEPDPRYPSFVYEYSPSGVVVYEKI